MTTHTVPAPAVMRPSPYRNVSVITQDRLYRALKYGHSAYIY